MVIATQRLALSRLASRVRPAAPFGRSSARFLTGASAADVQAWQERGVIDDRQLVNFETLHEMQVNSCEVYARNELFGTYMEASNSFEWMTYAEYAEKVDKCRAVLKDLGELRWGMLLLVSSCRLAGVSRNSFIHSSANRMQS